MALSFGSDVASSLQVLFYEHAFAFLHTVAIGYMAGLFRLQHYDILETLCIALHYEFD